MFTSNMLRFALALATTCSTNVYAQEPTIYLDAASKYVILSKTGISTVPTSSITGDIGVSPIAASAITGFSKTMDSSGEFWTSNRSPPVAQTFGTRTSSFPRRSLAPGALPVVLTPRLLPGRHLYYPHRRPRFLARIVCSALRFLDTTASRSFFETQLFLFIMSIMSNTELLMMNSIVARRCPPLYPHRKRSRSGQGAPGWPSPTPTRPTRPGRHLRGVT